MLTYLKMLVGQVLEYMTLEKVVVDLAAVLVVLVSHLQPS